MAKREICLKLPFVSDLRKILIRYTFNQNNLLETSKQIKVHLLKLYLAYAVSAM